MPTRRFTFFDVFQRNNDGSLTPRRVVSVNGVTFGPASPLVREFHLVELIYLDI